MYPANIAEAKRPKKMLMEESKMIKGEIQSKKRDKSGTDLSITIAICAAKCNITSHKVMSGLKVFAKLKYIMQLKLEFCTCHGSYMIPILLQYLPLYHYCL